MFNPIVAMLHNTKLNRWHPIVFLEAPLPGPPSDDKPVRHRSKGHHTTGFATRQEALDWIKNDLKMKDDVGPAKEALDKDFAWDGEDMPAMTVYFGEQDGKIVPLLG